ncbi:efflux RND transporter periplasmic adaptor subunit [Pelagicoccus sp. NFK12]|uniref:Efflux RND transporter periplasmic adaptor subunit n=1 Tax=Pelagicoccus enzymogenes TaxID=2773457 RepID=A0A927II69_9BACT|nr:efflux RND transporter periplasmic adaptor subunit [Pelagicoccus enzymogenes]MBD5780448.1 efflux RND transporter periplasmic adaptor subunit [Pelagicoccus enzymogenes]MDQ8197652.1 efflux RND transporter periplasmic adaptor subunit [Pelagicoccus enzymogenes]
MIRTALAVFLPIFAIIAVVIGVKAKQFGAPPPGAFPATMVDSDIAETQTWARTTTTTTTLRASQGVEVTTELPGIVRAIHFESGDSVEKGQLLIELDNTTEKAQLAAAKASAELAQTDLKRAKELREGRVISQSEYDAIIARAAEAEAQLAQIQSTLSKKQIFAPFSGRLGIREIDIGQYLTPGSSIVSLQNLDPLYADFTLPQKQIGLARPGFEVELSIDAYPDKTFSGTVQSTSSTIDATTRSLTVRAAMENPEQTLLPGMFGTVTLIQPDPVEVVAIPGTAISYQSYGNSVFVIKDAEGENAQGKVVEQRFVTLGPARGDFVAILDGLEPGEEVVSAGVFKMSNGAPVVVDNSRKLKAELDPKPANG